MHCIQHDNNRKTTPRKCTHFRPHFKAFECVAYSAHNNEEKRTHANAHTFALTCITYQICTIASTIKRLKALHTTRQQQKNDSISYCITYHICTIASTIERLNALPPSSRSEVARKAVSA
jgi:hypothetical protein